MAAEVFFWIFLKKKCKVSSSIDSLCFYGTAALSHYVQNMSQAMEVVVCGTCNFIAPQLRTKKGPANYCTHRRVGCFKYFQKWFPLFSCFYSINSNNILVTWSLSKLLWLSDSGKMLKTSNSASYSTSFLHGQNYSSSSSSYQPCAEFSFVRNCHHYHTTKSTATGCLVNSFISSVLLLEQLSEMKMIGK